MAAYIKYRKIDGYKYQLMEKYTQETQILVDPGVVTGGRWVVMSKTGKLTIKKGYAWDGPSGPTIDTPNFMRGSLVHDALYQLIREKLLAQKIRKDADVLLWLICQKDGMSKRRADYVYHAVRMFGGSSAKPSKKAKKVTIKAP